jgi:hypothetical protein
MSRADKKQVDLAVVLPPSTKKLLAIEVFVAFTPLVLLLVMGLVITPVQVSVSLADPLHWSSALEGVGMVACGLVGMATLAYVLAKLFSGKGSISKPTLVWTGTAIGAMPLTVFVFSSTPGWPLVGLVPLAVSAHILFLARRMLFSSWRDGVMKAVVAVTIALSLFALSNFDHSEASDTALREQVAHWKERAPENYVFTIQLSGYPDGVLKSRDVLIPKRIVVQGGKVISASYVSDDGQHKAGDPARMDNLWTIDHAFRELQAAEERGWSVKLTSNERWGFIEKAHAIPKDETPLAGWTLEVREFSAGPVSTAETLSP